MRLTFASWRRRWRRQRTSGRLVAPVVGTQRQHRPYRSPANPRFCCLAGDAVGILRDFFVLGHEGTVPLRKGRRPPSIRTRASCGIGFVRPDYARTPSHPLHLIKLPEQRPLTKARGALGEFAYGEVRFLLASARLAERYAPDLYRGRTPARVIRSASHLTRYRFHQLTHGTFLLPQPCDGLSY